MKFRFPWQHDSGSVGGSEARRQAEENLRVHQQQHVEVSLVAQRLRTLRETNHFSEQFEGIIKERPGG